MELRHLRYLIAVAEELHFCRAAKRLNISQPPVSRQIRQLEDELGCALFDRTGQKVRLTQAGEVFLAEARLTFAHIKSAADLAREASYGRFGKVTVGCVPSGI